MHGDHLIPETSLKLSVAVSCWDEAKSYKSLLLGYQGRNIQNQQKQIFLLRFNYIMASKIRDDRGQVFDFYRCVNHPLFHIFSQLVQISYLFLGEWLLTGTFPTLSHCRMSLTKISNDST